MDAAQHAPAGVTVCLTLDVDAVSLWTATFGSSSPSEVSRGEFAATTGVPRVLELLARRGVPATFFVPAVTARQFPDMVRAIAEHGHEVAAHGDEHEHLPGLTREQEAAALARGVETLRAIAGAAPVGFRAPGWLLSPHTIGLLDELGLAYDSSQMATDFTPYLARRDDVVEDGAWHPGPVSRVLELPVAWELDDFPYFFVRPPRFGPAADPAAVFEVWKAEFDYAHAHVPGGVYTLTMHPELIGRGPRLAMLDRLLAHAAAAEGTRFARCADVAAEHAAARAAATPTPSKRTIR